MGEPARTTVDTISLMEFQRLNSAATKGRHRRTPHNSSVRHDHVLFAVFDLPEGCEFLKQGRISPESLWFPPCQGRGVCVVLSLGTRLAMVDAGTSDCSNAGAIITI